MKVVINRKYGGFSLSDAGVERCIELGMICTDYTPAGNHADPKAHFCRKSADCNRTLGRYTACKSYSKKFRCDPRIVQAVEELGVNANGRHAELEVIDIPFDGTKGWHIDEYDGFERICENHRVWPHENVELEPDDDDPDDCSNEPGTEGVDVSDEHFVRELREMGAG